MMMFRLSRTAFAAIPRSAKFFSTQQGKVKWFDVKKGYGFLTPDDGSPDVFVHQTAIHADGFRSLAEGETVEFSTVNERGRLKADRVTGPRGSFVQGAPRPQFNMYQENDRFESFGGGFAPRRFQKELKEEEGEEDNIVFNDKYLFDDDEDEEKKSK